MDEVMTFFKFNSLLNNKTIFPFDTDFFVEKALNHPLSSKILQNHIIEILMYYHLKTENWVNKTTDIILKIMDIKIKHFRIVDK